MGNKQFLSILGYYNHDASIFDNLQLPQGINKALVIDNILLDNAQLSLVYTNFDFMKYAIGSWSRSELQIWDRLNKAFSEEYDPIWNVDENTTEIREIDRHGGDTRDITSSSNSNSSDSISNTDTKSIKGFNSDTWAEHEKNVNSGSNTNNASGSSSDNEVGSHNETITETFTRSRGGNIGVTMSQQLLEAELNVRPKLNIYKYISNSFKNKFCLMVY